MNSHLVESTRHSETFVFRTTLVGRQDEL
jgi:hypothetical protein